MLNLDEVSNKDVNVCKSNPCAQEDQPSGSSKQNISNIFSFKLYHRFDIILSWTLHIGNLLQVPHIHEAHAS